MWVVRKPAVWYVAVVQYFLVRRGCALVFGMSRLRNSFWYVAVAQYITLYGTFAALRNSLGVVARLHNSLPSLWYILTAVSQWQLRFIAANWELELGSFPSKKTQIQLPCSPRILKKCRFYVGTQQK